MPVRSCCSRVAKAMAVMLVLLPAWFGLPAIAADRAAQPVQTPAALYHNYCSVCHGDRGDGQSRASNSMRPPPRDFTTPQSVQELTRERMIAAVKGGVPGTAMVSWKTQLNDAQIAQVVDYVRDTFMRASVAADASKGRRIYARTCSVCHGELGAGSMWASANLRPPPRDFSSEQTRMTLTREAMLAAVAAGRPGTAMAGYSTKLSQDDMNAVVDFIRASFMRVDAAAGISGTHARGTPAPAQPPAHAAPGRMPATAAAVPTPVAPPAPPQVKADMKLPLPLGLRGDAKAGQAFYDANCATCHGVKGDGAGPRAYFINPKPRVFTSAESRAILNLPAIYAGVSAGKRGTEMPAWDKVLTPQEMANVSAYVFRSFIQPPPAELANAATRK